MKNLEKMNKNELINLTKATLNGYYIINLLVLLLAIFDIVGYFMNFDSGIYSIAIDVVFIVNCIVLAYVRGKLNKKEN